MGYIYKITNDINDKVYIGQTIHTINSRFKNHIKEAQNPRKDKKRNTLHCPLYLAMRKYGTNHFFVEQIEQCGNEQLDEKERYWIAYFNSYRNGYNATIGGQEKGSIIPKEEKELWWEEYVSGKRVKEISEKYHRNCNTISKFFAEEKQPEYTQIHKKIMAKTAVKNSSNSHKKHLKRLIVQYDLKGKYIKTIYSSEDIDILNADNVCCCVKAILRKGNHYAYGYQWKYLDDSYIPHDMTYELDTRVSQYDEDGNLIRIYKNQNCAAKANNIKQGVLSYALIVKRKIGKYFWTYTRDNAII